MVKICDMGLARSQPVDQREFGRELSHQVTTVWWQAPEMLTLGNYNKAVDIWAAGCIMGMSCASVCIDALLVRIASSCNAGRTPLANFRRRDYSS